MVHVEHNFYVVAYDTTYTNHILRNIYDVIIVELQPVPPSMPLEGLLFSKNQAHSLCNVVD